MGMFTKSSPRRSASLSEHPNFEVPPVPDNYVRNPAFFEGVKWALKAVALFISPPKVSGEDEEIKCEDLAREINGPFLKLLEDKIK